MQGTAMIIKLLGIVLQYGLLFFLLFFVFRLVRYMRADSQKLREDIYSVTEISAIEAVLTVLESSDGDLMGRRFAFSDAVTIGRGNSNDIVLKDSFVSHEHAVIQLMNNLYVIEDMGSINKTYVNGEAVTGRQYLQSGDEISIGSTVFQFGR